MSLNSKKPVFIVLDIGKTNKKILAFGDNLEIVDISKRRIETYRKDNLDVEDIQAIEDWFLYNLAEYASRFNVKGISISTHGAMVVCTDEQGFPVVPPISYTNEISDQMNEDFYSEVGSKNKLQCSTATCEIRPLINVAKLLWFLKRRYPEDFRKAVHVLFYPQYFGFRLTGATAADITSAGCHTYLWDHHVGDWSSVVDVLEIRNKLPLSCVEPFTRLGFVSERIVTETGLRPGTPVTVGIHDSNASLIPYLISGRKDFVLNSTGTWCVAMHPVKQVKFNQDEIGKLVFYNKSFRSQPVKTSIVMAGLEYDKWMEYFHEIFGRTDRPDFHCDVYEKILLERIDFIFPSILPGTGQFPDSIARISLRGRIRYFEELIAENSVPEDLPGYEQCLAILNLSVVLQSFVALSRVNVRFGTEIFVEGGFRQNVHYNILLQQLFPDNFLFTTEMKEATAVGAAVCCKSMVDGLVMENLGKSIKVKKNTVKKISLQGLNAYRDQWLDVMNVNEALK